MRGGAPVPSACRPFGPSAHSDRYRSLRQKLAYGLPRVKADPGDLAARLDCQTGSWLSMGPLASGVPMGRATANQHEIARSQRLLKYAAEVAAQSNTIRVL